MEYNQECKYKGCNHTDPTRQLTGISKTRQKRHWSMTGGLLMTMIAICIFLCPMDAQAGYDVGNIGEITAGSSVTFSFDSTKVVDLYVFQPTTTGRYIFSSNVTMGDPFVYLCTVDNYVKVFSAIISTGAKSNAATNACVAYNDNSEYSLKNFELQYLCFSGQVYYLMITRTSVAEDCAGTFTVSRPSGYVVMLDAQGGTGGSQVYGNYNKQAWLTANSSAPEEYIVQPTKENAIFDGYYDAIEGGTQYITSNGYITEAARTNYSKTLYAHWKQASYIMTYNNQGASNTTQTITGGTALPSTVTIPVRAGYTFQGYYDDVTAGNQYYAADGAIIDTYQEELMSANKTLYARWSIAQYTITYQGMDSVSMQDGTFPNKHTYGQATVIPNPTKTVTENNEEVVFMGWSIGNSTNTTKDLTLSATGYTDSITLTAHWKKKTNVNIQASGTTVQATTNAEAALQSIFDYPADTPKQGVTAQELSENAAIELKLNVRDTDTNDSAALAAIEAVATGEVLQSFDASVEKIVTGNDASTTITTTNLSEIPVAVPITINLPTEQQGKPGYLVYRYHTYTNSAGVEQSVVHQISNDSSKAEYFVVAANGESITVYTRMFSTFVVTSTETSIEDSAFDETNTPSAGLDVQGRVSQEGLEAVYKLDVSWGAMTFVFTTAKEWDPYNHVYGDPSYAWSTDSFDGTNNKITIANHSNSGVNTTLSFAREDTQLVNTEVSFHVANAITSDAILSTYLEKVAAEGNPATTYDTYLFLQGTPETLPGPTGADTYTKVGVITLTFAGDQTLGLTPKSGT